MKKYKFLSIVFVLLTTMALISCTNPSVIDSTTSGNSSSNGDSSTGGGPNLNLVGEWINLNINATLTVNEDGFSGKLSTVDQEGDIIINNNKIDSYHNIGDGVIKSITNNEITVSFPSLTIDLVFHKYLPDPNKEITQEDYMGTWINPYLGFYVTIKEDGQPNYISNTVSYCTNTFYINNKVIRIDNKDVGKIKSISNNIMVMNILLNGKYCDLYLTKDLLGPTLHIDSTACAGKWKNDELNMTITINSDGKSGSLHNPNGTTSNDSELYIKDCYITSSNGLICIIKSVTENKMELSIPIFSKDYIFTKQE